MRMSHKNIAREDLMPGGVNSPVRSLGGVGNNSGSIAIASGKGAVLTTANGKELIDYVHGWGSIIAGHAHPSVIKAVKEACANGLGFGMSTDLEKEYAGVICERSGLEMMRSVNSGTEATMTALRLARGATGRDLVVKFSGCYHGHVDSMLVAAGSGSLTFGKPSSAGVPANVACDTLVADYNDTEGLSAVFGDHGPRIAAVIVETVAGNMNLVMPDATFIKEARRLCDEHGAILIADEVMTGFRASFGLAIKDLFGIDPDLACMGKVIGGGMPVAAVGGKRKLMELLAPAGDVYQAGTLAGNPMALTAGLATLGLIDKNAFLSLATSCKSLCEGMEKAAAAAGVDFCAQGVGAMAGFYMAPKPPSNLSEAKACDETKFRALFHAMLSRGVLLPPSMYEACFIGLGHDEKTIEATCLAAADAFKEI